MIGKAGSFVISLDCELMWGVRDEVTKETYGQHILGDHAVISKLLDSFEKYDINATFAFVGFLFCEDKKQILSHIPKYLPGYSDSNLSPYANSYIETQVGNSFEDDKYHYGWSQIKKVLDRPGQEISTHTFSHYYCMEEGQTPEEFKADIDMAIQVANEKDIVIHSIIFPRNQVNDAYLRICKQAGICVYRGTERSWIYSARSYKKESLFRRFLRLTDAYLNLSGYHCYEYTELTKNGMVDIPSSRFLRPFTKPLKLLESLRLKRITKAMTYAAKNGLVYHLWWHPHNFGINQSENFAFLEKILKHYQYLNKEYSLTCKTMSALGAELDGDK